MSSQIRELLAFNLPLWIGLTWIYCHHRTKKPKRNPAEIIAARRAKIDRNRDRTTKGE